jgi:prefoldin beta subunit
VTLPLWNLFLQELDLLEDSSTVYKMVGPVLMKVDLGDAKDNVEKRLDFIKAAM